MLVARSWLAWGDVDVDYGREMYVPLRLLEGDVLYRDVRYPYGPFSPYLHALGYRLWRPHLGVLYADGIATTALVLLLLYDVARTLGRPSTAALATVLIMVDLTFIPGSPGTFSFIFPYAYPTLHGLLFLTATLAGALRVLDGGGPRAALLAGAGAGMALLAKPEFGVTALAAVVATSAGLALRRHPQLRGRLLLLWAPTLLLPALGYGILAMTMPPAAILTRGLFAPEYFEGSRVIAWLIAGVPRHASGWQATVFLLRHWGTSAFLYVPGLAVVGLSGVLALLLGQPTRWRALAPVVGLAAAATAWGVWWACASPPWQLSFAWLAGGRYALLIPLLAGVLVVSSGALVRQLHRDGRAGPTMLHYWILSVVGLALLARVPGRVLPRSYANFFMPIGIVMLVHLLVDRLLSLVIVPAAARGAMRAAAAGLLAGLGLLVGVSRWQAWSPRTVEITTARGTLRLAPGPLELAFRQALTWVRDHAAPGATLLSVPRGTALSFLSGHGNVLYETSPVVTAATQAGERAYVAALERDPPDLIVTSTVAQLEYGYGPWGVKHNQAIQRWIAGAYTSAETVHIPGYCVMTLWIRRASTPANRPMRPSDGR